MERDVIKLTPDSHFDICIRNRFGENEIEILEDKHKGANKDSFHRTIVFKMMKTGLFYRVDYSDPVSGIEYWSKFNSEQLEAIQVYKEDIIKTIYV